MGKGLPAYMKPQRKLLPYLTLVRKNATIVTIHEKCLPDTPLLQCLDITQLQFVFEVINQQHVAGTMA